MILEDGRKEYIGAHQDTSLITERIGITKVRDLRKVCLPVENQ